MTLTSTLTDVDKYICFYQRNAHIELNNNKIDININKRRQHTQLFLVTNNNNTTQGRERERIRRKQAKHAIENSTPEKKGGLLY